MAQEMTRPQQEPTRRPVDIFDAMRADLDRVFDRFEFGWPSIAGFGLAPRLEQAARPAARMDVREEPDKFVLEADLPGVDEKDVTVMLADGVLTIKGERKDGREEQKGDYHIAERSFGSFERTLRLPDGIDEGKIEASFDKGVLKIVAPKRPEALKAERKIEIKKA
jgi:HSP20 family protein